MKAEIISVGTELLLGEILNTNAQYLSQELAKIGIGVYYHTVVGDNGDRLEQALNIAMSRADVIITTGGLGPTEDDLTKEVVAKILNKRIILDNNTLNNISAYFKHQNIIMTENNKKQALIPEGSIILNNSSGTAPGCIIEENDKSIILLPGPPKEVCSMFLECVVPYFKDKTDQVFYSKVVNLANIGESLVEDKIKHLISGQINPTIATYANDTLVRIRITSNAKSLKDAKALIEPVKLEIYDKLSEHIYGEDDVSLEEIVVKQLFDMNMTISFAESLTGGMLTSKIVNFPSCSGVLKEGVIAYSNEAKIFRLGVNPQIIDNYGAVSYECAEEMAKGIARTAKTNIGVSTTGIAGPGNTSNNKPTGLVFIGVCINDKVSVFEYVIRGNREKVRLKTVILALYLLRKQLSDYKNEAINGG